VNSPSLWLFEDPENQFHYLNEEGKNVIEKTEKKKEKEKTFARSESLTLRRVGGYQTIG